MKNLKAIFLFSSLLFTMFVFVTSAQAHGPGHKHAPQKAISSEQVISLASKKVNELAKAGVIDISWLDVNSSEFQKKKTGGGTEWKVTFKNNKVTEKSKQTLYLFYSLGGQYIATNYTGE